MPYNPNIHHRHSIRLKGYDYSQAGLYFITICVQDRKCLFGEIESDEMVLNEFGVIACQQWQKLPEQFTNMELDVFQIMPNHMHGIIMLTDTVGAGFTPAPDNNNATDGKGAGFTPVPDNNNATDGKGAGFTPAPDNNNATDGKRAGFTPAPDNNNATDGKGAGFTPAPDNNNATDGKGAGASPAPTKPKTVGDIVGAYKSLVANDCLEIFKQNQPAKMMGKLWQRNYYEHIIRDEQSYQRISDYIINNPKNWNNDKFFEQ